MLEDRTIQKVVPTQGQVLNNLFLAENKNGGNSPVNTLKNLKKFIPYEHFKIEGLHCLKFLPEQRFAMQDRSQGDIFFSSPQHKLCKVCKISKVRQPMRISLTMF